MDPDTPAESRLSELAFVAFDTEATGYSNVTDRLVEIAGIRFGWREGGWTSEDTFEELIDPSRPIPAEVTALHGITDAMVAEAAPATEVLDGFFSFAREALLVVHYAPADVGMMAFAYARAGLPGPAIRVLDTRLLARRLVPGLPNYALETLAERLGLPAPTHRALPDARTTRALFEHCVAKLDDPPALALGAVLEHAGPPLTLEHFAGLPLSLPEHLEAIELAIAGKRDVAIEYRGGSKGTRPRRVTPSHLFAREGRVFLEGRCHLDGTMKSFRVDRIEAATLAELGEDR